jgi:hypothetical protein
LEKAELRNVRLPVAKKRQMRKQLQIRLWAVLLRKTRRSRAP